MERVPSVSGPPTLMFKDSENYLFASAWKHEGPLQLQALSYGQYVVEALIPGFNETVHIVITTFIIDFSANANVTNINALLQ